MINPKPRPCEDALIRSVPGPPNCTGYQQRWVLAATVLGSTLAYIDESVVNVALPAIETDLGTALAAMQWVVNAYTLCMAALLLTGGAVGDRFGRRAVFVTGIALFALASMGCGFAAGTVQLIAARSVQGIGGALLIPSSLAIIGAAFEERERGKAIGIWSGCAAVATGVGPLLGGWLVDHLSWRAIFLINPVLAIPTLWISWRHVPESRAPASQGDLDWRGTALALGGLGLLVYGLIAASGLGWHDSAVLGSLAGGTALLAAFIWQEGRSAAPMVPLEWFASRTFSGVNLLTLLLYGALGGAFFFLPFALIRAHGYSATTAGAAFLPFTIVLGVLSRWSGALLDRFGAHWPLTAGPVVVALGLALLAVSDSGGGYWTTFVVPMTILGLGMAVTVAPLTTSVINAVDVSQTGTASGVNNAVASVASLLVIAVLGTIATEVYDRSLYRHLANLGTSSEMRAALDKVRGGFIGLGAPIAVPADVRQMVQSAIAYSLIETTRVIMLIAAGMALAGGLCAAFLIRPPGRHQQPARRSAEQRLPGPASTCNLSGSAHH
jgi:EmrB/QacA subfamily drug resistance transporter